MLNTYWKNLGLKGRQIIRVPWYSHFLNRLSGVKERQWSYVIGRMKANNTLKGASFSVSFHLSWDHYIIELFLYNLPRNCLITSLWHFPYCCTVIWHLLNSSVYFVIYYVHRMWIMPPKWLSSQSTRPWL